MQDVKRQDGSTQDTGRQYDDAISDVNNDVCMMQDGSTMTPAGTHDDDVSNDAGPDVGRKLDGRKLDGRKLDGRKLDGRRTCRAQLPLRRWRAAALHCSSSQRCSDGRERCSSQRCCDVGWQCTAACSVLPALLQQRAGCRNVAAMASNALDLAALLRWLTARWTSQRVAAMSGSALGFGALLRCPTALQLRPTTLLYSHQSWNPKYLIAYSHLWAHTNPTNVHQPSKDMMGMPVTGHHVWGCAYGHDTLESYW
jgi:hypothetical protein